MGLHGVQYAPESKGKMERWFRTLQMDFEARLLIDPARSLEELNARLWRWIEGEYHQRPHSALAGQTPAERFAQRALQLRTADAQTDWEALFLDRAERRVRLDATFSLEGQLWEVPVHLRGQLIEVRFNPFDWQRVEIWFAGQYVAAAHRCDKHLNAQTYTSRDYERPDKATGPGNRAQEPLGSQPVAVRSRRGKTVCRGEF